MPQFRTVEISDARFECNNLRFITVKTPNLKGRGDICVFVPSGIHTDEIIPVVILLHGVYGSAWSWSQNAGVHLQAIKMIQRGEIPNMIIAMPSDGLWGDGSAYLPHSGFNFEKWIAEDVAAALTDKIVGASSQSPLFISGLSMGGYGALRIGAKYGARFSGISAHSSITSLEQMSIFSEEELFNYQQQDKVDEDVFETIKRYRNNLPPCRFDCGSSDPLVEYNRKLHLELNKEGIEHIYEEYEGAHEWPYWEKYVRESLIFFAKQLDKPIPAQ